MYKVEDIAKETTVILQYFDTDFVSKIPKSFLEKLKTMAEKSNILINIDKSKSLDEQKISEECKDLISLIYYNYVANENDKKEIFNCWIINEEKYQNELRDRYNVDNLFKSKKNISRTDEKYILQKADLTECKETIIKKIWKKVWNKISYILKIGKK